MPTKKLKKEMRNKIKMFNILKRQQPHITISEKSTEFSGTLNELLFLEAMGIRKMYQAFAIADNVNDEEFQDLSRIEREQITNATKKLMDSILKFAIKNYSKDEDIFFEELTTLFIKEMIKTIKGNEVK